MTLSLTVKLNAVWVSTESSCEVSRIALSHTDFFNFQAGLVVQSVMSATNTLEHRDVHGLSATDPRLRQWICVSTMPKDVGMPS